MHLFGYRAALAVAFAALPLCASAQQAEHSAGAAASPGRLRELPAEAPRVSPVAVRRSVRAQVATSMVASRQEGRPSKAPYVWTGALVGAGIAAVGFMLDDSEDAILEEVVIAIVVPASALIGAGLGWLVYEIRH